MSPSRSILAAFVGLRLAACLLAADATVPDEAVVALVGGEALVQGAEGGAIEAEIVRARPGARLRFRCLAWEGDTVFEQRRDLNFPPLEAQLDQVAAAVVVTQFGEMESLRGAEKVDEFLAAYDALLTRLQGDGARRTVILIGPLRAPATTPKQLARHEVLRGIYTNAVEQLAGKRGFLFVPGERGLEPSATGRADREERIRWMARSLGQRLSGSMGLARNPELDARWETLRPVIAAKNRLWFDFWRPQNWAFLNGDRTAQPSSRDHRDPSKRWFPAEMEEFRPLIEQQEREIDALAAKLAAQP